MKKIALTIITVLSLNLVIFATPTIGYADTPGIEDYEKTFSVQQNLKLGGVQDDDTNVHGNEDQATSYFTDGGSPIVNLIKRVIEYASYIIGSIAVILIMVAGFMFMASQGNQQKLDEAKEIFKYAAIGLVIVFMSYIITIFIQSIFISSG
ncbi:MAG: pilin [Candidatus Gracilibacteria bacterium]